MLPSCLKDHFCLPVATSTAYMADAAELRARRQQHEMRHPGSASAPRATHPTKIVASSSERAGVELVPCRTRPTCHTRSNPPAALKIVAAMDPAELLGETQ